jgi:hypothetical protein
VATDEASRLDLLARAHCTFFRGARKNMNETDIKDSHTFDVNLIPNRLQLSLTCLVLAVITLFNPSIMRGILIAWHMDQRISAKIKKARELCGQNNKPTSAKEKI